MAIKLFVSDIDGTLIVSGKEPSAKTVEAVKKMQDAGVIVTIASGRMHNAVVPLAKAVGVTAPLISYNGAMIKTVGGEILYSNFLAPDLVLELIDFFRENNLYLQTYSGEVLRYAERTNFTARYESDIKVKGEAVGWEGLKKFTAQTCKVLGIVKDDEENVKVAGMLRKKFGDRITITKSAPVLVEIMNPGISKAAAIKILAEKFNLDISEVAAIGDGDNDLPMLKAAGLGIAMGNATDEVKKSCKVTTSNCEDDGFAEAVDKYILEVLK